MRQVMAFKTRGLLDHCLMLIKMDYTIRHEPPQRRVILDRNKLMDALMNGRNRLEFLTELESAMENLELAEVKEELVLDQHWERIMDTMKPIVEKHFITTTTRSPSYERDRNERINLLKQQAQEKQALQKQ